MIEPNLLSSLATTVLASTDLPLLVLGEEGFGRFLGRTHPILVHFPIALIVVAAIVEAWRLVVARQDRPTAFSATSLAFAAVAAILAAATGWLNAEHESAEESRTLFLHRWLGVAVAILSLGLLLVAAQARLASSRREPSRAMSIFRGGLVGTAVLVGIVGHLGGEMVYGEGYLMKAWPDGGSDEAPREEPRQAPGGSGEASPSPAAGDPSMAPSPESTAEDAAPAPGSVATGDPVATARGGEAIEVVGMPLDPAEIFASAVLPAMQARCVECHGPDKTKAGLRLDSLGAVLAGAKGEAIVVAGDPDASELLRRVLLPRDDEEAMPPSGEALSEAEIEALRAWIGVLPASPQGG